MIKKEDIFKNSKHSIDKNGLVTVSVKGSFVNGKYINNNEIIEDKTKLEKKVTINYFKRGE